MPVPREPLAVAVEQAELQPCQCCESAQIQVQWRRDAVTGAEDDIMRSVAKQRQLPARRARALVTADTEGMRSRGGPCNGRTRIQVTMLARASHRSSGLVPADLAWHLRMRPSGNISAADAA